MPSNQDSPQNRLSTFVKFFKGYIGVMPLVTAALAPVLTALNTIPLYESQRKPLAAMSAVLGFLLLAWLFYMRRTFALGSITHGFRWIMNLTPLVLILSSIVCFVRYTGELDRSLAQLTVQHPASARSLILSTWGQENPIPGSIALQVLYLGVFLSAEAAFIIMAMREYANDVRGVSEKEWMFGKQDGSGLSATELAQLQSEVGQPGEGVPVQSPDGTDAGTLESFTRIRPR